MCRGVRWRGLSGCSVSGVGLQERKSSRMAIICSVERCKSKLDPPSHPKDLARPQFDTFPAIQLRPDVQVEVQALAHQTLAFARIEINHVVHVSSASVNNPIMAVERQSISDKVIPLFQTISLQGVKTEDFADFCKAVDIMKVKGHLTNEGLDKIRKLKSGMNRGRE